jgi:hypothetical protein
VEINPQERQKSKSAIKQVCTKQDRLPKVGRKEINDGAKGTEL